MGMKKQILQFKKLKKQILKIIIEFAVKNQISIGWDLKPLQNIMT